MGGLRVQVWARLALLATLMLATGSGAKSRGGNGGGGGGGAQGEQWLNPSLREVVENLEHEVKLSRELSEREQSQESQEQPRAFMVVAELDDEGRTRRASPEQLLRSNIVDEILGKMMQHASPNNWRPQLREEPEEAEGPHEEQRKRRLAPNQIWEGAADLSLSNLVNRGRQRQLLGVTFSQRPRARGPEMQARPDKRLGGIEFYNKGRQQQAGPEEERAIRQSQGPASDMKNYSDGQLNGILDGQQPNRANEGAQVNRVDDRPQLNRADDRAVLLANMVGTSLEAKRVENSRWNNLRGMWGKRSV